MVLLMLMLVLTLTLLQWQAAYVRSTVKEFVKVKEVLFSTHLGFFYKNFFAFCCGAWLIVCSYARGCRASLLGARMWRAQTPWR
jgi:hypothetical protein